MINIPNNTRSQSFGSFQAPKAVLNKPAQSTPQQARKMVQNINDFTGAANDKFLGGTIKGAVNTFNTISSGFNADEAEKKTNAFTKRTLGIDKDGRGSSLNRYQGGKSFTTPEQYQKQFNQSKASQLGEAIGTTQGVVTDVASLALPGMAAEKALRGTKALQALSKTNKGRVGAQLLGGAGGSLTATGIGAVQDIAKGNQDQAAQNALMGTAIDASLPVAGKLIGRGYRALQGARSGADASEIATEVLEAGADLASTARSPQTRGKVVARSSTPQQAAAAGQKVTEQAGRVKREKLDRLRSEIPANQLYQGNDDLPRLLPIAPNMGKVRVSSAPTTAASDTLPQASLARFLNTNDATQQAIDSANIESFRPNTVRVSSSPEATIDEVGRRVQANARRNEVRDAPALQQVEQTDNLLNPQNFNSYADTLLRNAGINIDEGLVQGNALYTNPLTQTYNKAQQAIIEGIDKGRDAVSAGIGRGLDSNNSVTSGLSRLPQIGFKNFGRSDAERGILSTRSSKIQSAGNVARLVQRDLDEAIKATGNVEQTNRRIYQVLETPDYLAKVFKDPTKLSIANLTPEERVVMDKLIASNKIRNDINLQNGQITEEQHAAFADGFHSPRIYDLGNENPQKGTMKLIDRKASIKRKDISEIDDAVTDKALQSPTLASSVRLEMALRNQANTEALDQLAAANLIRNRAPNKNYEQLVGKQYGQYEGQFIDRQIKSQLDGSDAFNSNLGQKTSDLVNSYQDSVLGTADRFVKKTKTVFAPATNIGNISSNVVAFSGAANVNPVTVATRMTQAAKQLYKHSKEFDPNVYRAEKAGLFNGDTGRQLVGSNEDTLKTLTKSSKNPLKAIESFYGKTDQAAALGIFNELKARGLTDAQAVRRAHKAVQDYNNAGRGVNLLADSPVLGKPFARFTPELLRIAKNNAIYNPVGTAAKVGTLAAGGAYLSDKAGETTEERDARENTVGQTKLPFSGAINSLVTGGKNTNDVSLNLPIGESAVNISRASGLNFPIEPGGDANGALLRQLSPVADATRTTADGNTVIAPNQLVSSMGLRPLADQVVNRDFMGRQITDPENRVISEIGKGKSQFENADGSRQSPGKDQENLNRLRALGMNYVPLSGEIDAGVNAALGTKDYYGKERTPAQAALRGIGIKTESNTKDVRERRVDTKNFFEGKDKQVKDFLTKNPEVADAYFTFNDSSRDRTTNKKASSLVSPEKWSVVKGETSGKLFNQLKQEALDANTSQGKPVDPLFQINDPARVKEIVSIRATAPGDNIEKEEILRATSEWYKPFEDAERAYYTANQQFFDSLPKSKNPAGQNDRSKAYSDVAYPEQSPLIQEYYKTKAANADAGKAFFKTNADALSNDFTAYKDAKLESINQKRDILGLNRIDKDTFNNVTFGYEDDEQKVARDLYYKTGAGSSYGRSGAGRSGSGSKLVIKSSDYDGVINIDQAPAGKITATRSDKKVTVKPRQKRTAKVTSTKVKS